MPYMNKWSERKKRTPRTLKRKCPHSDCGWCYAPNTEYTAGCVGVALCKIYGGKDAR